MLTADTTVPSDGMVCVVMSPAVTRVRNMAVAVSAIVAPVESFCIALSPVVLNAKTQELINVAVHENNTTTPPQPRTKTAAERNRKSQTLSKWHNRVQNYAKCAVCCCNQSNRP